ncbi:maestro heat-like repeat-containing protein family member 6 [Grus americana]|uniref:maestro heat-like repeat-containing protein family member 6 n=1 Tax=Grus americana TaxID=9117 RepID=UPI00240849D6|nr:maestro heat-like repeat-containing protein family member 6 [Grus americana]
MGEKNEEKMTGAGAAPAWQPDEVQQVQPLQADLDWEPPEEEQEQANTRALSHSRAQVYWESLKPGEREHSTLTAIKGMEASGFCDAEACAAMLDALVQRDASTLERVPSIVRCIYRLLKSNTDVSAEHRLDNPLLELTHMHAHDVVVTLLHCAPECDRAAATMWRAMVSMNRTAEKVLLELLCVLEEWPLHTTSTSDGEIMDIFALAATKALWEILQLPSHTGALMEYFPYLFLALLFQIFFRTEQMPEEVNTFWRQCQEEGCLPTNPNRFAVLTMKALFCRLGYENVMFEVERKRGWDILLNAETQHCAMGLLAREMRHMSRNVCNEITQYFLELLSGKETCWELPAMAFLVELVACPGIKADRILQLIPRYLQSECRAMRRMVLRALIIICKTPLMAKRMEFLLPRFIELLQDADGEVVRMTLSVLRMMLLAIDIPIASPIALQLAEALQPLFDKESSYVQLLSIRLFRNVMEFVSEVGKKPLEPHVQQSLLPLLYHLHDENQRVAKACQETMLQAATFLKMRKLTWLLKKQRTWAVGECLLTEPSSRADEYLLQSLLYLQSPQESIREAAVRFIAQPQPQLLRRQQESALWLWNTDYTMWSPRVFLPPSPSPALGTPRAQPCQGQESVQRGCRGEAALLG